MRKTKKSISVMLAALLVSAQLAGCANDTSSDDTSQTVTESESTTEAEDESTSEEEQGESTAEAESETEGETVETENDDESESESEDESDTESESESDSEGDAETVDALADLSTQEKYFTLMAMDLSEAREYFGVEEDASLTSESFDEFMESIFVDVVTSDRLTLDQYIKDASGYGIEDISSITYDPGHLIYTEEDVEESYTLNLDELKEMLSYPYDSLETRQQLVFDKMYYEYLIALWSCDVTDYSSNVALTNGLIPNLAITFYEYMFDTEENVKTYAKVMDYLPELILEVSESVYNQIEELDYAPTDYMLDTALESIEELIDTEDNPFIDGYNEKLEALGLDAETTAQYEEDNETFYIEEVIPALEQVYEELEALYGTNSEGQGLYYYDGGLEYYEYLVENYVGANLAIDELMDILEERLDSNMTKLLRYATLNQSTYEDYYYGNITLPGDGDSESIIEYLLEAMSEDFPTFTGESYTVSELPESLEIDGILAYYLIPRIDTVGENIIRINASATGDDETTLFMTLAHEGYPGHMLQFNVQQSCGAYSVEQVITHLGYSEGWAMYAEYKSLDYADISEAMSNIISLNEMLSYDIIAYIDLGVNGKGWDVDDVADVMDEYGFASAYADYFFSLVVGDPGVYLPYSLGYILTDEVIEDYVEETGATYLEAYESFMSIGAASFTVVEEYMGTEF